MVSELLDAIVSWRTLLAALLVFGYAPGALLRLIVLAFHRDDLRRSELLAELHAVPRLERPFWVFEQLEVALSEGIWPRVWAATGRIITARPLQETSPPRRRAGPALTVVVGARG